MIVKLIKNKFFILFLIILDIILVLLGKKLFLNISFLNYIFIILLIFIIFQFVFKIPIINIKKIKNAKIIKEKVKKLNKDELYVKPLKIDTFDKSGSLTHPSILYFENGFNGYKYYLSYTPYDNNNVELENPCIAVSNDGINFITPNGLKNPLLKIIKRRKPNTFYNDPFLMYTDKLELWYRYTIEGEELINDVYRICSKDGIKWSKPEKMISSDGSCYMSLSIAKKDELYYMYYFDMDYKFNLRTSKDLKKWSEEIELNIENFNEGIWHGEVRYYSNEKIFEVFFLSKNYKLYLATSKDGKNFSNLKLIKPYYNPKENFYKNQKAYKSSVLRIKNEVYFYIPFQITKFRFFTTKKVFYKKWTLTLTKINKKSVEKIMSI